MLPVVYGVGDSFKESGSEILITTVEIFYQASFLQYEVFQELSPCNGILLLELL